LLLAVAAAGLVVAGSAGILPVIQGSDSSGSTAASRSDAAPSSQSTSKADKVRAAGAYGRVAMGFEPNAGQTDANVDYMARGQGYSVFLTPSESVVSLQAPRSQSPEAGAGKASATLTTGAPAVLGMQLLGADPGAHRVATGPLPGTSNYFVGSDPQQWRTNVPTFGQVAYQGVYPGIDVDYHGTQGQLEYDFVVAPGADPAAIRLGMTGADKMSISPEGDLVLSTPNGEVRHHRPAVFQDAKDGRQAVTGDFVIKGDKEVGFQLGAFDPSRPLVIDPTLAYGTYLGGTANDFGFGIAVDRSGNSYLGGQTASAIFPKGGATDVAPRGASATAVQPTYAGGASDAFVVKLNPAGDTVLYSTYLGGSRSDAGWDLSIDSVGNAYLVGSTDSADDPGTTAVEGGFPTTGNAFDRTCGTDGKCNDVLPFNFKTAACDPLVPTCTGPGDPAFVPAICPAATFPGGCTTTPGPADNFLAKLNKTGSSLLYSTFLGGSSAEMNADEVPYAGQAGIAVIAKTAYLTSGTYSSDFPTTANAFQPGCASCADGNDDAYMTVIDTGQIGSASMLYSTYVGGTGFDEGKAVTIDKAGNGYLTGTITGVDTTPGGTTFPVKNPLAGSYAGVPYDGSTYHGGYSDAFVTKINPKATVPAESLVYSSFVGGGGKDEGWGIAVSSKLSRTTPVYLTGWTTSGPNPHPQVADPGHPTACDSGPGPFCDFASDPAPYFPVTAGAFDTTYAGRATTDSGSTLFLEGDAYATKVDASGTRLTYSTFIGGQDGDNGQGIAVDSTGAAYVTGWTTCRSQNPAGTGGALDPPPQFDPDGTATGRNPGEPAATGVPDCPINLGDPGGFPQVNPLAGREKMNSTNNDNHINDSPTAAFLTKLAPDGASVAYSILLDGKGFDRGFSVAVRDTDAAGAPLATPEAYVTGRTGNATDFTVTPGAYDTTYNGGGRDAFIVKIVG
jgi:hypothetical protein